MAKKTATITTVAEAAKLDIVKPKEMVIKPLREAILAFSIKGSAPLLTARFSEKARIKLQTQMEAGQSSRSKKVRDPRDFVADAEAAMHRMHKTNDPGVPCAAFRAAMISACRTVGFKMTVAKLGLFVMSDGLSKEGTPLIKISGAHDISIMPVRNASGVVDLRARPIFAEWSAVVRVRFDLDLFGAEDVVNLMNRAGRQVGIGEGRPDSRMSAGLGFGTFDVVATGEE